MKSQAKLDLEFLDSQQPFTVFRVRSCMAGVLKIQREWQMKPCMRWWRRTGSLAS